MRSEAKKIAITFLYYTMWTLRKKTSEKAGHKGERRRKGINEGNATKYLVWAEPRVISLGHYDVTSSENMEKSSTYKPIGEENMGWIFAPPAEIRDASITHLARK
jgi:hypothetical protein